MWQQMQLPYGTSDFDLLKAERRTSTLPPTLVFMAMTSVCPGIGLHRPADSGSWFTPLMVQGDARSTRVPCSMCPTAQTTSIHGCFSPATAKPPATEYVTHLWYLTACVDRKAPVSLCSRRTGASRCHACMLPSSHSTRHTSPLSLFLSSPKQLTCGRGEPARRVIRVASREQDRRWHDKSQRSVSLAQHPTRLAPPDCWTAARQTGGCATIGGLQCAAAGFPAQT